VQEKYGVTLLPTAAIQRNSTTTYVYLVKPDSTVTVRDIQIGTTEGDQNEVTSGLNPGDVVVMTGVDKLQEGSKVIPTIDGEQTPGSGGRGGGRRSSGGQSGGQQTPGRAGTSGNPGGPSK